MEIPRDSVPPNLRGQPSCFSYGWSWLILHNFLNPIKQATASLSEPPPLNLSLSGSRPSTSSSQPRFTAWLPLGISKPGTSNDHLTVLYSSGRVAPGRTQVWADLGLYTGETPEPVHPVDSYRSHQSTTILLPHSWSSTEDGGLWSVVMGSPCSWLTSVNPSHWPANSNQGSTTGGGCTQPTHRAHLEYPAWVIGEAVPLDPTGHLLH